MKGEGKGGAEKRRSKRFSIDHHSIVAYKIGFLQRAAFRGQNIARRVSNLSEGGACLLLEKKVDIGTPVKVLVMLNKFDDVFEAEGEVCWIKKSHKKGGSYEAGVRFTKVDPIHSRKIQHIRSWFTSSRYEAHQRVQARNK